MPFPTSPLDVTIEFAFGADLKADPATWVYTDVTDDWLTSKDLAATIGRPAAANKPPPAKLNFWLKNPSPGPYTKGNPMSPYWPYIRKNTPCRVTLDPGTGSLRVYEMYATTFIPRWGSSGDSGRQPLVQVTCNGVRRRLTQGSSPLRSPLHRASAALTPLAHWPLADGSDATQAASALPGGSPLTVTGQVKFASVETPGGDKAPDIIDGQLSGTVPTGSTTTGFAVHFAARMTKSDPTLDSHIWPLSVRSTDGRIWTWDIFDADSGLPTYGTGGTAGEQVAVLGSSAAGTQVLIPSDLGFTPFDGEWHSYLMVVTRITPTTCRLDAYFDGRCLQGTTVGGSVTFGPLGGQISIPEETYIPILGIASLSVSHVDTYDYPLNQVAAEQLAAGVRGWAGESAGNRIDRLCREQGVAVPTSAPVTLLSEGFESASLGITVTGTWARNSTQAHSGGWSYKSATIGANGTTDAVVKVPAGATSMSVWYKVSSESSFDRFQIFRDDVMDLYSSGEIGWTQRTINVVGVSQITFRYRKDVATVAGLDAAFIDDIAFTTDQRLLDMLDTATMGAQKSGPFVGLLDECQEADGGILLDGLSPGFMYLRRRDAYNLPVALTVDMAGLQFKAPFEPRDDDSEIVNDQEVTRVDGSSARYIDQDSVAAIERYDSSTTLNVYQDADLLDQAAWRTHLGTAGADGYRFPGIGFDLHTKDTAALIEPWLQGGIRTRVQVTHPPTEYGAGPIDLLVEGYTETVRSRRVWTVEANTSPYDPWRVYALGDPVLGRMGSKYATLATGVSATATSLSVATTSGPLWITTASKPTRFPFDIEISGVRIRVIAISGTSSPQTFTVTRSMDGFDKPLPTNALVRLWKSAAYAL